MEEIEYIHESGVIKRRDQEKDRSPAGTKDIFVPWPYLTYTQRLKSFMLLTSEYKWSF
jgi:hypothetical protein